MSADRLAADPREREVSQPADGTGEHTAGNQSCVHCRFRPTDLRHAT
jgi:hypothetical protein